MKCMIPQRIVKEISFFALKNGIDRVILFGSRARGNCTERSDIDLAVCGGDFDAFYWDIRENIHSLLTFDLVNFDSEISEELKMEVERYGVTVYEKTR